MRHPLAPPTAVLLGLAAATLLACGGSGKGLIPTGDAGPLQNDFEAVAQAAQAADGDCTATEEAIRRTEQDFAALPASVDPGLHARIRQGIDNLSSRARDLCAQPAPTSTLTTGSSSTTTSTSTTPSTTTTSTTISTSTSSTPTTTATTPPNPGEGTPAGGGTPAPSGQGENGGAGEGGNGQ